MRERVLVQCVAIAVMALLTGSCAWVEDGAVTGGRGVAPVVTQAGVPAAALPDLNSAQELESAIVAYGRCVETRFPIVIRFRVDPFLGMPTEIASQHREEGDLVDRVSADCAASLDLDRRIGRYQLDNPPSAADERALAIEFVDCARTISPELAQRTSTADLRTVDSVAAFVSGVIPSSDLSERNQIALSECQDDLYGPERVFDSGHDWFTP